MLFNPIIVFGTKNGCSRLLVSLYLTRYHLGEIVPRVNLLSLILFISITCDVIIALFL